MISAQEFFEFNSQGAASIASAASKDQSPDEFVVVVANLDGKVPQKLFKAEAEREGRDFDRELAALRSKVGSEQSPTVVAVWPRRVAIELCQIFNKRIAAELPILPVEGNFTFLVMHDGQSMVGERQVGKPLGGSAN